MQKVISDILAERERQMAKEGWSIEHDDGHENGELAKAAACYAYFGAGNHMARDLEIDSKQRDPTHRSEWIVITRMWPWDWMWWKPKDRRRDLVRAAALLIAEIERLDRLDDAFQKLEAPAA